MDYKDTLNLPKTSFPMKGRLPELEPRLLKKWEDMGLYALLQAKGEGRPAWVLHDGPPYANGNIHLGTALNKVLKDIIVKQRSMSGFRSPYVPGWDCHGLPIEHKVDQELGDRKLTMAKAEIRERCRKYALKYLDVQRGEFKRLGILGEWDNPYLTMDKAYEAVIARELGEMALDGRLSRDVKPVLWCGTCRTALAEAEVEYQDETGTSIYVAFKAKGDPGAMHPGLSGKDTYFVIWTTTPWTIPSNLAIAYNPRFAYSAWEHDGKAYVVARDLAGPLMEKFGFKGATLVSELPSKALEGQAALHPLYGRDSPLLPAGYVTMDQGTGLVHTAPGHGREDFETGRAHGLKTLSPLDDLARFTAEVPELEGKRALDSNGDVVGFLRDKGALLAEEALTHSYPHCWRCKNPVVFRATPQWFVSMERLGLREKALEAIDTVAWIPKRGRDRIRGMIENRPDWCVSRQRSWGVPITIFFCEGCGEWLYTKGIQERIFRLFLERGADAWFDMGSGDILPEGQSCPHCGGKSFRKETDILDVWFDSGSSFAAVCEWRDYLPDVPDMYLEGSDQHRGWFHSSLLISVANRQGRAPYREVLTHGYVVDGKGKKMSKSMGNTVLPGELIKKHGADILRLWVASENYQDDIRVSEEIIGMLVKAYFGYRNTSRFLLGNLADFEPERDLVPATDIESPIDRYALHLLDKLVVEATAAYAAYAFHDVYHKANVFMVNLSSFYLDVLKDRLYTRAKADPLRRGSQSAMWRILKDVTLIMAPILSFTAEEIWGHMPGGGRLRESVFLEDFPVHDGTMSDPGLATDMEALLAVRSKANKALEEARRAKSIGSSLDAAVSISASGETLRLLQENLHWLAEFLIVSEVDISEEGEGDEVSVSVRECRYNKCPRCWNRNPEVPDDLSDVCPKCKQAMGLAP
ncbi:MAG: isoleucine--tRNA ligase [Deltaproteobacteria bacterium]|jgi:isoleucyl-tRNA synthetase|nr:isoleucine--tRNA ligase [Deltaproteobacteria bacterium]